jgi:hypothetical protein
LEIACSAAGSGVSMPQKTVMKPASRISSSTRSFLAMLSVASQAKRSGYLWRVCQSTTWGKSSSAAFWLPMKLSSTKYTLVAPAAAMRSSSRSTCSGVFKRGLRPYSAGMSQNSHEYGHPLENCMLAMKYSWSGIIS